MPNCGSTRLDALAVQQLAYTIPSLRVPEQLQDLLLEYFVVNMNAIMSLEFGGRRTGLHALCWEWGGKLMVMVDCLEGSAIRHVQKPFFRELMSILFT